MKGHRRSAHDILNNGFNRSRSKYEAYDYKIILLYFDVVSAQRLELRTLCMHHVLQGFPTVS